MTDDADDKAIEELENAVENGGAPEPEPAGGETDAIEDLAREMGWAPEDEWRGDPDKHVDARTFIKTGPEILKSTLRRQDEKLDEVAETMKGMARAAKGAETRAYDKAVADLKARQEEAVVDGDIDEFRRIDTEIGELDKPAAEDEKPASDAAADPHFEAFQKANPWYGEDYEMSEFADRIASHVGQKFQGAAFYEELTSAVQKKFPSAGSNKKRDRPPAVEGGAETNVGKKIKKSYNDLPAEAREACNEFVEEGVMTKEQYVEDYFADEEAA